MRKLFTKLFLPLFAAGVLISATSCEKCRECTAFESGTNTIYYYERQCFTGSGSSSKINDWESTFRSNYAGYYIYCNVTN